MFDTEDTRPATPAATEPTPAPAEPNQPTAQPAEAAADAAHTEDAAPSTEDQSGTEPAEEGRPKKKGGGFQNRIDQLTREKYEADLRAQLAERQLAEMRAKQPDSLTGDPGPEPKLEEFSTVEDFLRARDLWANRTGYQAAQTEAARRQKHEQLVQAVTAFESRENAARQQLPDYDSTVGTIDQYVASHPTLAEFVMNSDVGPELAYHLAKNPAALAALARLPDPQALRELARMEARLAAPPPPKPVTAAPPPVKPVGAREAVSRTLAEIAASDDASAYITRMNRQGRPAN